ncbi:MAG: hypothetical protein PHW32_03645 [Bacilli bacterium]|nr:hypothetical protein [Bacilli bacterium]MDD4718693.1 hypothetical protein [Bacilli bacterium]
MPRQNKRRTKRVKNLIVVSTLSAVLLSISTYAWFIGMRSVNVSAFEVEIAAADSLLLSLDGVDFQESVTINKDNYNDLDNVYEGNTNNWTSLIPISTIGEIDPTTSRLKLYEKSSMTPTAGGYRIMTSQMDNFTDPDEEVKGYIAFDLFVKNITGAKYYPEYLLANEEAIYLTVNSEVNVDDTGGIGGTGIENSVRVAFAQIGRVPLDATAGEITGISCSGGSTVTSICSRTAQIWEPNDTSHVEAAIKWYNESCQKRIAKDIQDDEVTAYGGSCNLITDGLAYQTHAINQPIGSGDKVDIYDGPDYNTFQTEMEDDGEGNMIPKEGGLVGSEKFLTPFPYFKDTQKYLEGTERPPFMHLAPSSITKVRIYVYIEGQDIDNYDFAQIGKMIKVNFGFTKERFTEKDIDYPGPDIDEMTSPRIEFADGKQAIEVEQDDVESYSDDLEDITVDGLAIVDFAEEPATFTSTGTVNLKVSGTYYITYKAYDAEGNLGTAVRTIVVKESVQP